MISSILQEYHALGLVLGFCTFLIIGLFHPLVIKGEYHFGTKCWWVFGVAGIGMCVLSYILADPFWSTLAGVVGFSSFWSIKEIYDQRERVRKGWFPKKPGKK